MQSVQLSTVANLEGIPEFVPPLDPQLFDGHRTSAMFSLAHVRKPAFPRKLADMDVLWLNDIRGGQHPLSFADLVKQS